MLLHLQSTSQIWQRPVCHNITIKIKRLFVTFSESRFPVIQCGKFFIAECAKTNVCYEYVPFSAALQVLIIKKFSQKTA